jgi:hypothetical protein
MCDSALPHPDDFSQEQGPASLLSLPSDLTAEGRAFLDYFLIHGNKASTHPLNPHESSFDDFNPDNSLLTFRDRLSRYGEAHSRALDMANWIGENVPLKVRKQQNVPSVKAELEECGSYLKFRHFYTVNQIKLSAMCSCKRHLLCPLCAIRRAAKYVLICSEYSNVRPYLVTFTVRDGADLQERFYHLQNNLRFYYEKRRKALSARSGKSRHIPVEANKALGGVGSYEVKRGSNSGLWHPHAHFIWLCEEPPNANLIRKEWHDLTGDSYIVDVTPFRSTSEVAGGFLEVFKYALKFSSMTLADNWESFLVLRRRQLVSSFGIFRGVEVPDTETDDISFDELPYIELFFKFLAGSYRLSSVDSSGAVARVGSGL